MAPAAVRPDGKARGQRVCRNCHRNPTVIGPAMGLPLLCGGILLVAFSLTAAAQGIYPPGATVSPPRMAAPGNTAPADTGQNPILPPITPAWILTPSIELGEAYNDNVNLAPRGAAVWDFITTVTPALQLTGNTPRLNVGLVYDPQELIFARGTSSNTLQQRLLGSGLAELWPEALFFDAKASIDQEFIRSTGPIGPTTLTTNSNLQTVEAASGSPYLLHHFGNFANSETRYRFAYVSTSGNTIAPEQIQEARQVLSSGDTFGRLQWVITGDYTKLDRLSGTSDPLGGTSGKDAVARTDVKYPVYAALSVIGGAGYERITDPTLLDQPHGLIWDAGLQYDPNPNASASLTYGRRFNQTDYEFNAKYNVTQRLRVTGIYTQLIQTGESQIAGNLNQLQLGPGGTLVNSQTGLPFAPSTNSPGVPSSAFGITSGAFLEKRLQGIVEATQERNTYLASAYYVKQSGQAVSISAEKIAGGSLAWTRQLWPDLTSNAGASYYRAVFQDGSGRIDNSYSVTIALAYDISRTASAKISLSRFDTRSNIGANSLVNDLILASIRKQF
jgi:uncharacterized protein (PEP-CTERM system associated)